MSVPEQSDFTENRRIVHELSRHRYILRVAKISGDGGNIVLLRVLEQMGFPSGDIHPASVDYLIMALQRLVAGRNRVFQEILRSPSNRAVTLEGTHLVYHEVTYRDQVVVHVDMEGNNYDGNA